MSSKIISKDFEVDLEPALNRHARIVAFHKPTARLRLLEMVSVWGNAERTIAMQKRRDWEDFLNGQ